MKNKKLTVLAMAVGLSVLAAVPAFATERKLEDGWIMKYGSEESIDESSGYYNVYYYRWEQQADGTWKLHKKRDYWTPTCDHSFGHSRDPRLTCPGEMVHVDEYVAKDTYGEYFLDENGIMVTDKWVSAAERNNTKWHTPDAYELATYWYYGSDGTRRYDMVRDGYAMKDGVWRDPNVIPVNTDGTLNMQAMTDEQFGHYLYNSYELMSMYTFDQVNEEINRRPNVKDSDMAIAFRWCNDPKLKDELNPYK